MSKKTVVDLNQTIKNLISSAKSGKQAYRDSIQKALELFVAEYNGALTYNTTYFKEIVLTVGKDIKDLRNWIYTYTNITKVYSDLLHFETSSYTTTKDGKKLYQLSFKPEYNGQLWYSVETDKKAAKELTNDTFEKTMKATYKRYMNTFLDFDEKTEKLLQAIKTIYNLD
jgi:hypothetical protein